MQINSPNYDICSVCKRFGNMNTHICPALWQARADDWPPDEYSELRADTAKDAACDFVEYDLLDTSVIDGTSDTWRVWVRAVHGPDKWEPYDVDMEIQPVFTARVAK